MSVTRFLSNKAQVYTYIQPPYSTYQAIAFNSPITTFFNFFSKLPKTAAIMYISAVVVSSSDKMDVCDIEVDILYLSVLECDTQPGHVVNHSKGYSITNTLDVMLVTQFT